MRTTTADRQRRRALVDITRVSESGPVHITPDTPPHFLGLRACPAVGCLAMELEVAG